MPELVPVEHDPFADESAPSDGAGVVGDVAKAVPRGAAKATMEMMSAAGRSDPVSLEMFTPSPEQMRSTIEELYTGPWGEAKTIPGKYAESVGGMLPTAWMGMGSSLAKGAGAVASGIGAQFGEDVAGTPGRLLGAALGGGVVGGMGATRTLRPDFEETFSAFERLGLKPTAATTGVGGKTAQYLEANVLPQAIGSANRMHKTMEGNLTQFTKKQQEIASRFGAPKPKAETGSDLQETVLQGWEGRKAEAGKIFNAIGRAFSPNDKFYPDNLVDAVLSPKGAASSKAVRATTDAPEIQELRGILQQTGSQLSYADLTALKSKFGDMLDPRYAKPVNSAQVSQIVKALDDDIGLAVKSLGNKDVYQAWKDAKSTYASAMQDYRQAFKKLLGTREMPVKAERVYDILVGQAGIKSPADMEAFKRVWGQLGKDKQGDLSATVLSHMGNKDPEKLGDLEGFSLSTFLTNYKNVSPEAKALLFKSTGNADLEKSLDDLVMAANKMGVWSKLESTSKSGTVGAMGAQLMAPMVFAATGQFARAASAMVADFGGPALAAKLLTDPKWVKRLAYALDNVNAGLTGSTKALLGVATQMQMEDIQAIPSGGPPQENPQSGNQIPRFAQGGIVTKPTVAMVGEKGPEAIVPLAKQQGQNLMSGLEGQIGAAKQHQQSVLTGLENKFGGMEQGFMGWLEGLLSRSPQGQQLLQGLQQRGIPGFAEGGVVTEPTIATLGEKGPEAVIPLGSPAAASMTHQVAPPPDWIGETGRRMGNLLLSPITAPIQGMGFLKDLTERAMSGEDVSVDPRAGGQALQGMQSLSGVSAPLSKRGAVGSGGGKLGAGPEHIIGAAVTAKDGRVFSAPNHFLAMEKAAKELGVPMKDMYDYLEPDVGRFVTNQGRMLDRAEAGELLTGKKDHPIFAEELLKPSAAKSGERINFQSAGAQRGEPAPGKPQPERKVMTPEEKAEWKKRADAEMQAHLEKMAKTKEGRKIITDLAKKIEKGEKGGERIGFKSLETDK